MDKMRSGEARITAVLLSVIARDSNASQRRIASELGIALGLVNVYVKRCTKKGLIKVRTAPASRYAYYLTPKGLAERSKLTAEYLSYSLSFFRQARVSCGSVLETATNGLKWRNIALLGSGDLTEIAILCALDYDLRVVAIVDAETPKLQFIGTRVIKCLKDLPSSVDGVIVTSLTESQITHDSAVAELGAARVLAPEILGISTRRHAAGGAR